MIQVPDQRKAIEYLGFTKLWEDTCTREIEKFGGDTVLINEERLRKADRQLRNWIELYERLITRHPSTSTSDTADLKAFKEVFDVRRFSSTDFFLS